MAIHPGGEPIAGFRHGPARGGKDGRGFIPLAHRAKTPNKQQRPQRQHSQHQPQSLPTNQSQRLGLEMQASLCRGLGSSH